MIDGGIVPGGVYDGGTISPGSVISGGADVPPSISPGTLNNGAMLPGMQLPGGNLGMDISAKGVVPNRPIFSHVIGDRKLQPGETLKGAYELPVESAAKPAADKK